MKTRVTTLFAVLWTAGLLLATMPCAALGAERAKPKAPRTANVAETGNVLRIDRGGTSTHLAPHDGPTAILTVPVPYATITAALAAAAPNDIIDIAPGTYAENVIVNKSVLIRGAGATSTTIVPSFVDPSLPSPGTFPPGHSTVFVVAADNVTIEKLTINGNNPLLISGTIVGGADIDARNGVVTDHTLGTFNGLEIRYTTIKNIFWRALYPSSGGTFYFHDNVIQNVQGSTSGSMAIFNWMGAGTVERDTISDCLGAIVANHSKGMRILDNVVTNSLDGVHSDNGGDGGGVGDTIRGNIVTNSPVSGYGIWLFVPYIAAVVENNTVTNVDYGFGAFAGAFGPTVTARFTNNGIDGQNKVGSIGFYITNTTWSWGLTNVAATLTGNEFRNVDYGMYIESGLGYTVTMNANGNSIRSNVVIGVDSGAVPTSYGNPSGLPGTLAVSLTSNWWGNASGPFNATTNPSGTGDAIDDGLDHSPWWGADYRGVAHPWNWYANTSNSSTIQEAIGLASAGDVINVAAGTYNESLDISKPLTILGAGQATTFIDQSANAAAGNVVYIHGACGSVTLDGFTINTGIASSVACNGVSISGLTAPGTITISNNTIWGNQLATNDNLCLIAGYFSITTPKLVFDHNIVHGGWSSAGVANPILIERWMGPTEITNNTVDHGTNDGVASDVIVFMNYDYGNITQKQLISGNSIDMGWGTTYDASHRGAGITFWSGYNGGTLPGGYTNLEISNNSLFNFKPSRRGISLYNSSGGDGSGGNIAGAIISGNTVSNATSYSGEFGIRVRGKATATQITNNLISGVNDAVLIAPQSGHEPVSTSVNSNSLLATSKGLNNSSTATVNGSGNWWGSYDPTAVAGTVTANVDYTPWLNFGTDTQIGIPGFQPDLSNLWVDDNSPQVGTTGRIQEGVNLVSGSTVNVAAGTYREQIYINKDLTLQSASGSGSTFIVPPFGPMSQPFLPSRSERPILGVDSLGTNVVIDGFTVDGEGLGDYSTHYAMSGIQYFKASGEIRNSTVKRIRPAAFDGAQVFIGILVNHDNPRSYAHTVEIHHDSVYDCGKGNIIVNHPGSIGNVHHNVVVGQGPVGSGFAAQLGIQFGWEATGTIANNTISGFSYTGGTWSSSSILGIASGGVLQIHNNTITDGQMAIDLEQYSGYPGACNAHVYGNVTTASLAGTGGVNYYGSFVWSLGTALSRPEGRRNLPQASPYAIDEGGGAMKSDAPEATMNVSYAGNTFTSTTPGTGTGIYLLATDTSPFTMAGDSNDFNGYQVGVVTDKDPGASLTSTWRKNKFTGNQYGMYDLTGVLQDARENWWNDANGPADPKLLPATPNYNNPGGLGDSVSAFVDYMPWYFDGGLTLLWQQQHYSALGGWNIVSVPLTVSDRTKSAIFPSAVSNAFSFNSASGYVAEDTLLNGIGYWLKFPGPQGVAMNGVRRSLDTIEVASGWNMIGTISDPVPAVTIQQEPPGIITSAVFWFDGGYGNADTLWPAKGYWVKASDPGILILSTGALRLHKEVPLPSYALGDASAITVTDVRNSKQTLYFTSDIVKQKDVDFFEFPPPPPAGVFDARFSTNRMLENVKNGEERTIPIHVSYAEYPLTISWDMNDQPLSASLLIGTREVPMSGASSITVPDARITLALKLGGQPSLPKEFALSQNYPNPFNPSTTIKYDLPKDSRVSLKLFNMLGQEVATLVNEEQKAGYKSVEWNARLTGGQASSVASGVYFYRIQAGDFVASKKLLFLK